MPALTLTNDIVAQGTLGTTSAIIRTGAAEEVLTIRFVNYGGSDATFTLWANGTTDTNLLVKAMTVDANGGAVEVDIAIGSGDVLHAVASVATTIAYTIEMRKLA